VPYNVRCPYRYCFYLYVFSYHAYMAKKSAAPVAMGSKEIPTGAPNCLEGLAFVFTGDLSSIGRDEATDLVKRYGGRVTTAPSGKTDFVVAGEAPGESKMEKVKKLGLKTLDEDGFLDLIRERSAKLGYTAQSGVKIATTEIPPATAPAQQAIESKTPAAPVPPALLRSEDQLWTVKYAPGEAKDLIGNHSVYEKFMAWLQSWNGNTPPQDFRAALLSGPPGIGKTSMAHMVCKAAGYDVVELNASDTRSKKTLHDEVREVINNSSLAGFFTSKSVATTAVKARKQAIIMDECDGMSAGDRGGMAELIQLIKKTRVPIICVCNDRASPKVRSLANYCLDLRFRRPDARQVVPRISEICKRYYGHYWRLQKCLLSV
jgi:replication factor C subunit 1